MIVLGVAALILGAGAGADTTKARAVAVDSSSLISISRITRTEPFVMDDPVSDTVRQRRRSVEVSEWYARRLKIHRYGAALSVPVFALQYIAGQQLYTKGSDAPGWAKTGHRVGATTLAGIFAANTVTGAWNWWESRSVPKGRALRTIHALGFLGADAAFTYAGVKLANEAENSAAKRSRHRNMALTAVAVSVVNGVGMKLLNR
jgi:hypothetical protein